VPVLSNTVLAVKKFRNEKNGRNNKYFLIVSGNNPGHGGAGKKNVNATSDARENKRAGSGDENGTSIYFLLCKLHLQE